MAYPLLLAAALGSFALSGVSTAFKIGQGKQAAEADLRALETEKKIATEQTQQRLLSTYDAMEKTLNSQIAAASTRGYGLGSPSFQAIQTDTLNTGGKAVKTIQTEQAFTEASIESEKRNVKRSMHARMFGDIANFAITGANFFENFPRKSGSNGSTSSKTKR